MEVELSLKFNEEARRMGGLECMYRTRGLFMASKVGGLKGQISLKVLYGSEVGVE